MKARKPGWFHAVQGIHIDTPNTVCLPPFVSIEMWSAIQEMGAAQVFDFIAGEMHRVGGDGRWSDSNRAAVQSALARLANEIGKAPIFQRCKKRYAKRAK